jgi:hypothetical protein
MARGGGHEYTVTYKKSSTTLATQKISIRFYDPTCKSTANAITATSKTAQAVKVTKKATPTVTAFKPTFSKGSANC